MVTYCVKCKSKTETINPKYKTSKTRSLWFRESV